MLAMVETLDNGKPIRETTAADLPLAVDHFRYFAGCIRAQEGSVCEIDHTTYAYHFHEPLGRGRPDHPVELPAADGGVEGGAGARRRQLRGAEAGRADADGDPGLAEIVGDLLPPGVLNIVNGFGVEAGKPLASNKRIDKVAFTGETTTGRLIMQYAAENIIPVTLELGGKSPNLFFADVMAEDDDFQDKALEGFAMFALNQGEVCTCPSRALIQESIYDRFMEKALARVKKMKQGHPLDPETMVGAQASNDQLEKILSYIDIGRKEGAKVLTGGAAGQIRGRAGERLLRPADDLRRAQQDARLPGGDLRPVRVRDDVQDRGGGARDRQRHALRPRRRAVDARPQPLLPRRPRPPSRPRVGQLLSPLSGARRVRRLQAVRASAARTTR